MNTSRYAESYRIQTYAEYLESRQDGQQGRKKRPEDCWLKSHCSTSGTGVPSYGFNHNQTIAGKRSISPLQEDQASDETEEGEVEGSDCGTWSYSVVDKKNKKLKTEDSSTSRMADDGLVPSYADIVDSRAEDSWLRPAAEKRNVSPVQEEQGYECAEDDGNANASTWPLLSAIQCKKSRKNKKRKTGAEMAAGADANSSALFDVPQVW